jgi:hypothetical protein
VSSGSRRRSLAPAYQLALDLEAEGLRGPELAERLGVPLKALPSLLAVARAKAEEVVPEAAVGAEEDPDAAHPHGR